MDSTQILRSGGPEKITTGGLAPSDPHGSTRPEKYRRKVAWALRQLCLRIPQHHGLKFFEIDRAIAVLVDVFEDLVDLAVWHDPLLVEDSK